MGDLGTWVTIGDLVACVEPSRRRQRGRHLRDLLLELHAPDLVALGRVLAVPRAVLVGDALLDLERGPGRGLSLLLALIEVANASLMLLGAAPLVEHGPRLRRVLVRRELELQRVPLQSRRASRRPRDGARRRRRHWAPVSRSNIVTI